MKNEPRTSTELPEQSFLTNSRRLRSQRNTCPSIEADRIALSDLEIASVITGVSWPKRHVLGWRSTVFEVEMTDHTDIVQSTPAVIRVRESANRAHESWP